MPTHWSVNATACSILLYLCTSIAYPSLYTRTQTEAIYNPGPLSSTGHSANGPVNIVPATAVILWVQAILIGIVGTLYGTPINNSVQPQNEPLLCHLFSPPKTGQNRGLDTLLSQSLNLIPGH